MATATADMRRRDWWTWRELLLCLGIGAFAGFQFYVSLHRYDAMRATTMDLGVLEQELWEIAHGHWRGFTSVFQDSALAQDGSFWDYPLAFVYRVFGVPSLFMVQAVGTALAAWGVYRAAQLRRLAPGVAMTAALVFLLLPAILNGSQFDVHPDFIALPFLVWAYVYYRRSDRVAYWSCLVTAVLAKYMALISIFGWGIGLLVWERRWRDGLLTIGVAAAFLVLEVGWFLPTYAPGRTISLDVGFYQYLGRGIGGILWGSIVHAPLLIAHLAANPAYDIWVVGPVLGLALFGSAATPAWLAAWVFNGASTFPAQHSFSNQYQVMLSGWLALALIEALGRWRRQGRRLVFAVFLSTLFFELILCKVVIAPLLALPVQSPAQVEGLLASVPTTDVLWTQQFIGVYAYRFPNFGIDREPAPGVMLDGLPVLWQEAAPSAATAIVARRPTTPYMAQVIEWALQHGYRVTVHHGLLFAVEGTAHFPFSPPASYGLGYEPLCNKPWTLPLGALTVRGVDWATLAAYVPRVGRIQVLPPLPLVLPPGRYRFDVEVHAVGSLPPRTIVGHLWWNVPNRGAVALEAEGDTVATVCVARAPTVTIGITSTGVEAWWAESVSIERLGPSSC
jgi:uncharacterized membrane protein